MISSRSPQRIPILCTIAFLLFGLLSLEVLYSQELSMDPRDCGYACSAKDVIISNPYLASDMNGTPMETCNGDSREALTAYIAFSLENTTGSDRYTPMLTATLNIDGVRSTVSGGFASLLPQETAIRVLSMEISFYCESEIFLEEIWIGWNVSPKTCEQLQGETRCNGLIPSGKCGDYNSLPEYLSITVDTPIALGEENTLSRCSDGVDNDGNGLTDCDDFDCAALSSCEYTSTSSGNDGGLESNNRLLEQIAKRQYQRSQQPDTSVKINRPENKMTLSNGMISRAEVTHDLPVMEEVIPLDALPETVPYLSTPEDLPQLTNAYRSLSVDYFRDNQAVAAILGTRTRYGVYEHTKAVCDRVGETRVEKIWSVALDGIHPMLVDKLRHKDGRVEYSCSFSIHLEEDKNLFVESHWNIYEYPKADNFLNFQVWAANTQILRELVNGILHKLKQATSLPAVFRTGTVPQVYIHRSSYRNRVLELEVANPYGIKSISVSGVLQRVEGEAEEKFEWNIALSGDSVEFLEIDTEGVYSLGITLWGSPEETADTIFFADGLWALDIDPSLENAQFMVFQDFQNKNDEDWFIERGVRISGQMNEKYVWYRALNNTFKAVELSSFKSMIFETQFGHAQEMEVVLAQPGLAWEEQLRTKIFVTPGQQTHTLALDAFEGNTELLNAIHMVVFVLENTTQSPRDINLELRKMRFSRQFRDRDMQNTFEGGPEASLRIFPNPLAPQSEIGFFSSRAGKASWKLTNSVGKEIRAGELEAIQGNNQQPFYPQKLSSGVYYLELQLPDADKLQTAVLVR